MSDLPSLLTLEQWAAMPEDELWRTELQEGVLLSFPGPGAKHQMAVAGLIYQLHDQVPAGWEPLYRSEPLLCAEPLPTVRVPDVMITRLDGSEHRILPDEVLVVVEIIADGTRNLDRWLKAFEYAAAGIPYYWLVDPGEPEPSITVHHLRTPGEPYVAERAVTGQLSTSVPFPLAVDIPMLFEPGGLSRRRRGV